MIQVQLRPASIVISVFLSISIIITGCLDIFEHEPEAPEQEQQKVVVIGLDGACWEILDPMMEEGRLPNISRLIDHGVRGTLDNIYPLESSPAWASISTGLNPGKLGIFDIYDYETLEGVNATKFNRYSIWNILSNNGYKVCVDNVKASYPPSHVNGFHISGKFAETHEEHQEFYPPDLYSELKEKGLANESIQRTKYLMQKYDDFDLYYVVFDEPDLSQHMYWHLIDPEHPLYSETEAEEHGHILYDVYQRLDSGVGDIMDIAGEDANYIVLSDSGFTSLLGGINMNKWLWQHGLLELIDSPQYFSSSGDIVNTIEFRPENINWSATKAYFPSTTGMSIYINKKGREPYGVVDDDGYDEVVSNIVSLLKNNLTIEGERLSVKVMLKHELYNGPYMDTAPDVVFEMDGNKYMGLPGTDFSRPLFEPIQKRSVFTITGFHDKDAVIIMSGPDIAEDIPLDHPSVLDIAPTVLALMDVPILDYVDGRPLTEALLDLVPSYTDTYSFYSSPPPYGDTRSQDDLAMVDQQVRALRRMG